MFKDNYPAWCNLFNTFIPDVVEDIAEDAGLCDLECDSCDENTKNMEA